MIYSIPLLALSLGASAAVIPRQENTSCTFSISTVGTPNGTVTEDTIGENRIGSGFQQGIYHLNGTSLLDVLNHNCIIYADSQQFQCTQGAEGATSFTVANGNLLHDGSENWLACPASGPGNDGSYNIFSDAKLNSAGCQIVTLKTVLTDEFCGSTAMGQPTSSSVSPTSTSAPATVYSTSASCPTDISSGTFQFPHLIVPTSPEEPDNAFGNQYEAIISPANTTLFNFDIPPWSPYTGTCALLFLFPYGTDLDPSAGRYTFSGVEEELGENGGLDFALLSGVANGGTTYHTTPGVAVDYGKTQIIPGNEYTIAQFPCQSGQTVTYSASSVGNVELQYFQDDAPSAIGLYIVPCSLT